MFDKVNVKAEVDEQAKVCTVYVNWSWVIPPNLTEKPACKLFCCGVEQDKLINRFLFRKQEILDWFDREVVNFSAPNYDNIFRLYNQNPSNLGNCFYSTISFQDGGSINRQQPLRFPYEAKNRVFFICLYDGERCEHEIVAVNNGKDLQYELTRPKKLFGMFGDDTPMIRLQSTDPRQKVMVVEKNGFKTYVMLPKCASEYYVSKELADLGPGQRRIKYLTDFI